MRRTKLLGLVAATAVAAGALAAPAGADRTTAPGQVCKAFLATPGQTMFTGNNAQGKCASFVARGGTLPPPGPPGGI